MCGEVGVKEEGSYEDQGGVKLDKVKWNYEWGAMAQLVAHPTPDREVGSSILSGLTLFIF